MLEGSEDGMKNTPVSTGIDAAPETDLTWKDVTTNVPVGLQACPVLHGLPVLAAVSASFQQSPAETECPISTDVLPSFIEQGF